MRSFSIPRAARDGFRAAAIIAVAAVVLAGASVVGVALADLRRGVPTGNALAGGSARPAPVGADGGVIPWSPRVAPSWTPAPAVLPTPLAVRPCAAADLAAASAGFGAAAGTTYTSIRLANTSATPCQLGGMPVLRMLDRNGRALGVDVHGFDAAPMLPVLLDAGHDRPAPDLDRAGEAVLRLAWWIRCGERAAVTSVEIGAPAGGTLIVPLATEIPGRCDAGDHYVSSVSAMYEPSVFPPTPTPTPPPLVLSARIDAPASVANDAGPLRYTVTLTNETGSTYTFDECPIYTEWFVKNFARYYLACESVRSLAPGASAKFEMRLDLDPRLTPPQSEWDLRWELEPPRNSAWATTRIRVTPSGGSTATPAPKSPPPATPWPTKPAP